MFILIFSVNPLSFSIEEPTWLQNWRAWKKSYEHFALVFCFADDLKTYASDKKSAKLQLDLISQFTRDISMQFGSDKCAYLNIERGNQKSLGKFLTLDETKLAELTKGGCYKYLGQDENIGYNDVSNKERVMKEYMKRIGKIWPFELYSNNKVTAHNTFAIAVLTRTFGIIKWTKE